MASRLPNDEEDEASAAATAAAFQSLAQQVGRPMMGWDPVAAMATMHRSLLQQQQQQQQHQQHQNIASLNQSTAAAAAAMAAATGLSTPTSSVAGLPPALWPYALQAGIQQPQSPAAAAAAVSLASSLGPATSYLNHLQSLHNPESLVSLQQQLLLLEQFQQQRQLFAANPHLLLAAAAAQSNTATTNSSLSPQQHQSAQQQHLNHLLAGTSQHLPTTTHSNGAGLANLLNHHNHHPQQQQQHQQHQANSNSNSHSNSLLTTVDSSLTANLTNQHQDSLVDQHFRRSLGDSYNQIMASKAADKINVGK